MPGNVLRIDLVIPTDYALKRQPNKGLLSRGFFLSDTRRAHRNIYYKLVLYEEKFLWGQNFGVGHTQN